MMEEMKMIDELFDKARTEKPRLSFEDASKAFFTSALAVGGLLALKKLLISKIGIVMISSTAIISTALILSTVSTGTPEPKIQISSPLIEDSIRTINFEEELIIAENYLDLKQKEIPLVEYELKSDLKIMPVNESIIEPKVEIEGDQEILKPKLVIIEQDNTHLISSTEALKDGNCSKSFCIKSNDKISELDCIQKSLRKLGLDVEMEHDYDRNDFLEMLKLRIQHENGLDLKLKVAGFTTFALMCIQDENGELIAMKYKIDKEEYSEVSMTSKTSYSYMKSVD